MSARVAVLAAFGVGVADDIDRFLAARSVRLKPPTRLILTWRQFDALEECQLIDWQAPDARPEYRGFPILIAPGAGAVFLPSAGWRRP